MKKTWFILLGGLFAGLAAYACVYLTGTASERALGKSPAPALAWLQQEFHLTDEQFARIRDLHDAYRPICANMCRRIDEKNTRLRALLAATNVITPEIKQTLAEAAQLRAECEGNMLAHFYAVAQTMPPEQGQRYLAWVQKEALAPSQMLPMQTQATAAAAMR